MDLLTLEVAKEPMKLYEILALTIWTISLVVAFVGAYRQLRIMRESREHTLIVQQVEAYVRMTTSVTDNEVETMMLHIADHFEREIYLDRYHGRPNRIRSYLLMKKKYIYLFSTTSYSADKNSPGRQAVSQWMRELCQYQEFRDVHASQYKYYPKLAASVDEALAQVPQHESKWASEPWGALSQTA
jgi:hypothetical protein